MPVKNEYYKTIQGWFTFAQHYERAVDTAPPDSILVEVGSWRGQSIVYLGTYAKERGRTDLKIYAVDTWAGTEGQQKQIKAELGGNEGLWAEFNKNISNAGLSDIVIPMRLPSLEGAKQFLDESCYFVYLDADHAYLSVLADCKAWWPKISVGGFIAGHDFEGSEISGVERAVYDFFGRDNVKEFLEDKTWLVDKHAS